MKGSLNWALIGASTVAREWVIDAIRAQPGNHIQSVLSRDPARGAAFAREYAIPSSTTDLETILQDPQINAVYVSTENALHHDQVVAAARAGKHVLCEKPLALSVQDAQAMVEACREARVVMATNHHLRCSALHLALHEHLKAGAIGRLNAVRVFHANFLSAVMGGWRLNDTGGGVFLDSTIHDIDTLRFHLESNPMDVFAMTQSGRRSAAGVEDGIMAILRFPNDVLVQIHGAYSVPYAPGGIEFYGETGALIGRDCMSQRATGTLTLRNGDGERDIPLTHHNLYHFSLERFTQAAAGNGQPAATGADGVASLAIVLALKEAARTGRQIEVVIP